MSDLILDLDSIPNVRYSLADGQRDQTLIQLHAHVFDGSSEWISADGQVDGVASFSETSPSNQRIALRSFVSKQAGDQVLAEAVSDFRSELQRNARAKMFVVDASVERARRRAKALTGMGLSTLIAIGEDADSNQNILRFKNDPTVKVLVGISKIHEGINVKAATHMCYLPNVRTMPHAIQVIGRVLRFDDHPNALPYEQQIAHVFVPADPLMLELLDRIKSDGGYVATSEVDLGDESQADSVTGPRSTLAPLSSSLGSASVYDFATGLPASAESVRALLDDAGLPLNDDQVEALGRAFGSADGAAVSPVPQTSKQRIMQLRQLIESSVRQIAVTIGVPPEQLNSGLKAEFGKGRAEMTEDELRSVYQAVCELAETHQVQLGV